MSERTPYFPVFIPLSGRHVLVVGAGSIALRRIRALLPFGPSVYVVAPRACEPILELARQGRIVYVKKDFSTEDLTGANMVLSATDDSNLEQHIAELCRRRGIPVNTAGDHTSSDFFFPSLVRKDQVVIGISSDGHHHGLVKEIRQTIEKSLGVQEDTYY